MRGAWLIIAGLGSVPNVRAYSSRTLAKSTIRARHCLGMSFQYRWSMRCSINPLTSDRDSVTTEISSSKGSPISATGFGGESTDDSGSAGASGGGAISSSSWCATSATSLPPSSARFRGTGPGAFVRSLGNGSGSPSDGELDGESDGELDCVPLGCGAGTTSASVERGRPGMGSE